MCTESSKGPNNHVCVVFDKFKSLRTPTFHAVVQLLNPAEFNLHVLDPKMNSIMSLKSLSIYVVVNDQIYL